MSTVEEEWGGLTEIELGLLIGGVALFIIIILILINYCICRSRMKDKKKKKDLDDPERMLNMQTERTVNGQNMKQVIVKSKPNGNMDRYNQNNIPYQTMDPETNTVRYDTANQSMSQEPEPVTITFHDSNGSTTKVVTTETDDIDSGTGASPTRTSAVVHEGQDNGAFQDDGDESGSDEAPYGYSMPPPPESMPPPLTPGTPVTDLDADEAPIPPPPPMADPVYAEVKKNRASTSTQGGGAVKSVWRPSSEIEIIEKAKF